MKTTILKKIKKKREDKEKYIKYKSKSGIRLGNYIIGSDLRERRVGCVHEK